jgi:hypothetical protein
LPTNSFWLKAVNEMGFTVSSIAAEGLSVTEADEVDSFVVSDAQAVAKTNEKIDKRASIFLMMKYSRQAFGLNAILAWIGVIGSLAVDATGVVVVPQFGPSYFGGHADGLAGSIPRVIDNLSYFTIWSNILVAITTTMIYRNMNRTSQRLKVLRLSSLMMITVTMLVYILILAPDANPQSWNIYTDLLLHYITPPVTILVWLFFGPRKWISWKIIFSSLLIPITYILYTFARGAVIGKYPYGFINVFELGYVGAMVGTGVVLVLGLFIFLIYFIIDKLIPSSK